MIEGGGLGVFRPDEVGPMSVQVPNGVVDIPVADEAEAVYAAKRYLSYFQGPLAQWECADQRLLRGIIPENRLRIYNVRSVIETLADTGSVLEIRRHFGHGMVTALIRVEGRPLGVIANNPTHLAGAIASYLNFRWLKQIVEALGGSGGRQPRARTAVLAGLRYGLLAAGAYGILNFSALSLRAALAGLFVSVAAVILEILFELLYAGT